MFSRMYRFIVGLGIVVLPLNANAETVRAVCWTATEHGQAYTFTVTENPTENETSRGLFRGVGRGTVKVRTNPPLKLQYPTQFSVQSYWSKRFSVNIFSAREDFHFRLQSDASVEEGRPFPATIYYGHRNIRFDAICELN